MSEECGETRIVPSPLFSPTLTVIHRVACEVVSGYGVTPLPITEHDTPSRFKVKILLILI